MIVRYIVERLFNEKWAIAKEIPFNVGSVEKAKAAVDMALEMNNILVERLKGSY